MAAKDEPAGKAEESKTDTKPDTKPDSEAERVHLLQVAQGLGLAVNPFAGVDTLKGEIDRAQQQAQP